MKKIRIIGISAYFHDSAVALIENGEIMYASQEERFSRIKHDSSFPKKALKNLLENCKLDLNDVDYVVFFEKPFLKFERLIETYLDFAPRGLKQFLFSMPIWLKDKLFMKKEIIDNLKKLSPEFNEKNFFFSEHHLSHAASAFFPSPFKKALIFTADGVGEWATTSVAVGENNTIKIKKEINYPNSLGLLYSAFTYYIGFKVNSGEYKLMGLAPYGKPIYADLIEEKLVDIKEDGSFRLDQSYFDYSTGFRMTNNKFNKLFKKKVRKPETKIQKFHMNVAASIQKVTEKIILKTLKSLKEEYNLENLCLAGGVALNCVANGLIQREKIFKNIWIQPAAGDAGGSLGSALALWHMHLKKKRNPSKNDNMKGSYLGPSFSKNSVKDELEKLGANYKILEKKKMIKSVAKMISKGKAIGWFQGKMEFGPRALGNRSIIADPRSINMQKNLNLKVKYRESFRPFAPSILRESLSNYFNLNCDSPYMLLVASVNDKIKKEMNDKEKQLFGIEKLNVVRSNIPAVTHVDYSSRIQTVDKNTNEKFYNLISHFNNKTNCPLLVNTSFNIRGEPIVNTVEDAFKCFMGTGLDTLVIGNFILRKNKQNLKFDKEYKDKYNLD